MTEGGWRGWGPPHRLSPALAPSCPSPPGSRSWWYFSCLARIRSILWDAARDAPELPRSPVLHHHAGYPAPPRALPAPQGAPTAPGGLGGAPRTPSLPPPKTHSLPFELSQRLLLSLPVGAHALHEAGSEQCDTPAAMGTMGGGYRHPAPSGTPRTPPSPPGSLQGRSLEVQHDVQEVVAEEDAALEQEEEEADAVPDDASLLHRQRAVLVLAHLLGWQAEGWGAGEAAPQNAPFSPSPPCASAHGRSSP